MGIKYGSLSKSMRHGIYISSILLLSLSFVLSIYVARFEQTQAGVVVAVMFFVISTVTYFFGYFFKIVAVDKLIQGICISLYALAVLILLHVTAYFGGSLDPEGLTSASMIVSYASVSFIGIILAVFATIIFEIITFVKLKTIRSN